MKLSEVIFYVTDIETSLKFYKQIGLKIDINHGTYVGFKTSNGETCLSINSSLNDERIPGHQVCVFTTQDAKHLYESYLEKNISISSKLIRKTWGNTFTIADPDGNKIEFLEYSNL